MGKDFVALANDLGIVLDAIHASDDVFDQMSDLSRSAIICSHSGCRAVHDHPRNLDDARIKRLAAAGSTIQINSYNEYLVTVPPNPGARQGAWRRCAAQLRAAPGASAADVAKAARAQVAAIKALDRQYPIPRATFETYMQHVMHALDLVGPDHVGVGADWDGGGGVIGMEDVTCPAQDHRAAGQGGLYRSPARQFLGRQCPAGAGHGASGAQAADAQV